MGLGAQVVHGFFKVYAGAEYALKNIAHFFYAGKGVFDVELVWVQAFFYFFPVQRHAYRRARTAPSVLTMGTHRH